MTDSDCHGTEAARQLDDLLAAWPPSEYAEAVISGIRVIPGESVR
jgi:hypothetical protein